MESTNPRILTGVVTSNKADKTITVKVESHVFEEKLAFSDKYCMTYSV